MAINSAQLKLFLAALATGSDPMGLIVVKGDAKKFELPNSGMKWICVSSDDSFVDALERAAAGNSWLRIDMVRPDVSGPEHTALRSLVATRHFDVVQSDGSVSNVRFPNGKAVVVVIPEHLLDSVTIPNFLNLFGPVLREE